MKLPVKSFIIVLLLSAVAGSTPLSPNATWLGSPESIPGSSWTLQIVSSDPTGTRLTLDCPGFWAQPETQQGQIRTRTLLVDPQLSNRKSGSTGVPGLPDLPAIGRLLAIPNDRGVEVIIHQVTLQTFPCDHPCVVEDEDNPAMTIDALTETYPADWAQSSTPGILKDYRLAPLALHPLRYDPVTHELLLATHLDIEVRTTSGSTQNVKTWSTQPSQAFMPFYQDAIDNLNQYNSATPLYGESHRGKYMIIIHDDFVNDYIFANFVNWKRELGYKVVIDTLHAAKSNTEIKADIQNEYFKGDESLDYVLLIGDRYWGDSSPLNVATWSIEKPPIPSNENDPTDHPYAMLEGNDYFPDVMLGRISVRTVQQLETILNKNLSYQKDPTTSPNPNWLKSALVSAGCYSDTPPYPITPAWSSLWLADQFWDYGYTRVDTVIYGGPYGWYQDPQLGTQPIANSINAGDGIVAYRGWGAANGWQYPAFYNSDIEERLNNGYMLPVVASIVCQTASFTVFTSATEEVEPCFGELWLRTGTPYTPKGGVAFYGPTELHTKTNWNNAIYAGFFEGLLDENMYHLGQSVLRSKLATFYGFPDFAQLTGGLNFVNFYFHVYTTLGDPELGILTTTPDSIILEAPTQVSPGQNQVIITAHRSSGSPLSGAYVSLYKASDNLQVGGVTNSGGLVSLQINPLTTGPITVTVSKQNCRPLQDTIQVQAGSFPLGMSGLSVSGDGVAQAGETVQMNVALKNFGPAPLTSVQAALSENDPYVSVGTPLENLGTIPGSGLTSAQFDVALAANTPNNHAVEFTLDLNGDQGAGQVKFLLPVGGLQMLPVTLITDSGSVAPGHTAKLRPLLMNNGLIPGQSLAGTPSCQDNAVTIAPGMVSFPVIQPGSTGLASSAFTVLVASSTSPGRQVILNLALTASGGYTQTVSFPVQLGTPASSDPLGPDGYGYYAYDNTDTAYTEAPTFGWIELDPRPPYNGTCDDFYPLKDDANETIHLPFTFTYYGMSFDTLTICSNGFVNFGRSWMSDFRNWNIPSPLGPSSLIAPFWDDLKADTIGGDSVLHVLSRYDAGEGRFIVEWSRTVNRRSFGNYPNWIFETFELVLFDPAVHVTQSGDGEFLYQYLEVSDIDDWENYCTVGMEDEAHQRGLQYSFSNNLAPAAAPLVPGRAIKITTNPPVRVNSADNPVAPPASLSFASPAPNPANPGSMLSFALPSAGHVRVDLYDVMGRRVAALLETDLAAGSHTVYLNGETLANGLYFAVLHFEGQVLTRKVLILK